MEEISKLPPPVAQVPTSIPAFIGYTEKAQANNEDLTLKPFKICSLADDEQFYGLAQPESSIEVTINSSPGSVGMNPRINVPSPYLMYYALQLFFDNGGGPCISKFNNGSTVFAITPHENCK